MHAKIPRLVTISRSETSKYAHAEASSHPMPLEKGGGGEGGGGGREIAQLREQLAEARRLRVVKARRRRQQREAPPRPWKSSVTNSTACARLKAKTSSKPWPKRQTQTRAHVVDPTAGMAEDTASEIPVKGIKMDEVEKHSSIDDLWLVIDGTCACRDTTDAPGTLCASRLRRFLVFNFARGAIDTAASTPTHPD